jgi:hypothetical protein
MPLRHPHRQSPISAPRRRRWHRQVGPSIWQSLRRGRPLPSRHRRRELVEHVAGISTAAIVSPIDAGERPEHIAADDAMTADEIAQAVLYERAA